MCNLFLGSTTSIPAGRLPKAMCITYTRKISRNALAKLCQDPRLDNAKASLAR
jgi:hypothetical protein